MIVYLSDHQSLLSRFTQGLAGRYLHLKSTAMLPGTFRPTAGTTDGFAIYLPEAVNEFADPRHNLGLYRVAILHQLGYYEFGTFDFTIDTAAERLGECPVASSFTPSLRHPDDRPVDLELFFEKFQSPALARRLFMLLEDHRIDCRLPVSYPGIRVDLQRAMSHALSKRSASQPHGIIALLASMQDYSLGADVDALLAADRTGLLPTLLEAMKKLSNHATDVYDTAAATCGCYQALLRFASAEGGTAGPNADEDAGISLVSDSDLEISGADFRGELIPELVQRQLRLAEVIAETDAIESLGKELSPPQIAELLRQHGHEFEQSSIENPAGKKTDILTTASPSAAAAPRPHDAEALARLIRAELDSNRVRIRRDESILRRTLGDLPQLSRSFFYDEWDYVGRRYCKGWCRLYEQRLDGDDFSYYRRVLRRHRLLAAQIENQLRRIRAASLARVKRVVDGDELDLDQLLTAVVDRRAGAMPDERVYSRQERTRREVATAFLLDMSASTDDTVPEPETPRPETPRPQSAPSESATSKSDSGNTPDLSTPTTDRRVIDVAKDALVLMSAALTTLGDSFAVYGFSGYGRDQVDFYVAKEFDDGLNVRTTAAIAEMKPKRSTRMGPAIRHAVYRLQQQDATLKVLIILSDGFPQDCDYGPDRNDHEYGIQDTARAIAEAADRGITCFCLTVDQSGHDYLRRMCPADRYLVIKDIASLSQELSKVYQLLTV